MRPQQALLFAFLVLPGASAVLVCGHYLLQDWAVLITAFGKFEQAVASEADMRTLYVAGTRDLIFRINCFADGVGVMLGALLLGLGVHGLCTMPAAPAPAAPSEEAPGLSTRRWDRGAVVQVCLAGMASLAALLLFASLIERVGETNALRRAVVRGDTAEVRALLRTGADADDRFWWACSPADLAARETPPEKREEMLRLLHAGAAGR